MTFDEFNTQVAAITQAMQAVRFNGTAENVANMYVAAATRGLVFMDCDALTEFIPIPICTIFVYRDLQLHKNKTLYLVPADQEIPQ